MKELVGALESQETAEPASHEVGILQEEMRDVRVESERLKVCSLFLTLLASFLSFLSNLLLFALRHSHTHTLFDTLEGAF
jgi:hypothetical protein